MSNEPRANRQQSRKKLIIGTRGSPLARWQAEHIAARLRNAHPDVEVSLHIIVTEGDRFQSGPLIEVGGKGVWVKEIEAALLDGTVDLAVHSLKDVPAQLAPGLVLAAIPERADPRDALVARNGQTLATLPRGARIGTSSLRRTCQLARLRPDLEIELLRGNVDTRLRKVADGTVDAAILACAGLDRLGHDGRIQERIDPGTMLPAIGQGALAIESRALDDHVRPLLKVLHDEASGRQVAAERALLLGLGGDCRTPLGGHATITGNVLTLTGLVGKPDGSLILRDSVSGALDEGPALGAKLAHRLLSAGADAILRG